MRKKNYDKLLDSIEDCLVIGIITKKGENQNIIKGKNHFISRLECIIRNHRGEEHLLRFYKKSNIQYVKNEGLSDTDNMNGSYYKN